MIEHRKTSVTYRGDGVTTSFPFSFDISSPDTIRVAIYDMATETTTEITRDYFVDVPAKAVHYPGYAPGQAPAAAAQPPKLPNGKTITIYRKTPINQLTNLGTKYPLPSIEAMADKVTAIVQEYDEVLGRTVTLPAGDPKTPEQRLTDLQTYVLNAKNAASAADQSARSAGDSKNAAASSATHSAQSAAASEASRQASAESENKIKNMQVDVHAIQQHVDEVKTAIDGVATRAKTDGQTATDAAVQAQRSAGVSAQSAAASEASAKRAEAATKYEGIVKSENLAEKSVHKQHLSFEVYDKGEVNGRVNVKVNKSGDTMTGPLNFAENENMHNCILPSHYFHNLFNNGDTVYIHAFPSHPAVAKKTRFIFRTANGTSGASTEHLLNSDGFTTNRFISRGNGGLYFQDHGGGWYMSDNDWIRAHWNKNIYTAGKIKADGGFEGDLHGRADSAGNSDTLGGQPLQWIIDQINAAKTGIVASNIAPNGWVKFANGLIVQWGMGSEQISEDTQTVIFPITFSRGCFSLITGTILSRAGNHNDSMWQVATVERERAVLFHQHFSNDGVGKTKPTYIAIGV